MHIPPPLFADIALADAWAETLVHRGLLHAAVRTPSGEWLVQDSQNAPVRVLADAAAVLTLVAGIQRRLRTARERAR
ncbi:hypothetical protein ACFY1V_12890 [Streptomyces sp. NPDC001255]|uniref:hypothetical protein n=1 Tax=Streptomyces sp. NPDC001255 TaxID=3364550 RepID=UPI0036B436B4